MLNKRILHSGLPEHVGHFPVFNNTEYMQYLYLPVKLRHKGGIFLEPRLRNLRHMLNVAWADYSERSGLSVRELYGKYIYVTVKQTLVPKDLHHNRPGWHADGFMTDDVQYIWFDKWPTEFLIGDFMVTDHDNISMTEFEEYGLDPLAVIFQPEPLYLYYIDENNIHRTSPALETDVRTFIKITISSHKYAQEGNSINYELPYSWKYQPRKLTRNQPQGNDSK